MSVGGYTELRDRSRGREGDAEKDLPQWLLGLRGIPHFQAAFLSPPEPG